MVSKRAKYGWQWGGAGPKDRVSAPTLHSFVLPHPHPTLYDGENFLAPFPPFRALRSPIPPHPVKLHFLLICPQLLLFFNKTYLINKNIFEITNKFIPSNQTNF